jgi:23S rRNA pseudouridine1911/1915/1917 synthase
MSEDAWLTHVVRPYEDGWTVGAVLLRSLLIDERDVRRLERERGLRVNRRPVSSRDTVRHADALEVRKGAPVSASGIEPVEMPLRIVHEDEHVLVLDKPPYLRVHAGEPGQRHTLVNGVAAHYRSAGSDDRIHLVHRLDRDTSGLVLLARSSTAHRRLAAAMDARDVRREYLAVASGLVGQNHGVIDAPIARNPSQPVLRMVGPEGDPAVTRFRVLRRLRDATLVSLELETGRTHQIRVHLAHIGHPIVGDRQYGRRGTRLIGRQALHAARLRFPHPATSEPMVLLAPLPDDIADLVRRLGGEWPLPAGTGAPVPPSPRS